MRLHTLADDELGREGLIGDVDDGRRGVVNSHPGRELAERLQNTAMIYEFKGQKRGAWAKIYLSI